MGPFSGSSHALLLFLYLTNSFRGGNNSFCNTEPQLPACSVDGTKHGLGAASGVGLTHSPSLSDGD